MFFITKSVNFGHFGPRVHLDKKESCVKKSQVHTKDGVSLIILFFTNLSISVSVIYLFYTICLLVSCEK